MRATTRIARTQLTLSFGLVLLGACVSAGTQEAADKYVREIRFVRSIDAATTHFGGGMLSLVRWGGERSLTNDNYTAARYPLVASRCSLKGRDSSSRVVVTNDSAKTVQSALAESVTAISGKRAAA
jgi:hypothetical protein